MVRRLVVSLAVPLALVACSVSIEQFAPTEEPTRVSRLAESTEAPTPVEEPAPASSARTDVQGAVEFVIEPLNLNGAGDTLDFAVTMNTHAVDVGWDLAALSTLESDIGRRAEAIGWPIGSGHHYGGTLSFPRRAADGADLLEGASVLRLTIRDTDIPERVFTWEISP